MLLFMLLIRKHASECDGIVTLHTDGTTMKQEIGFTLISLIIIGENGQLIHLKIIFNFRCSQVLFLIYHKFI